MVFRTVPEPSFLWGALRPKRRLLARRLVLPWKFRQVCSIILLCFGKLGTLYYGFSFAGAAGDIPCFSGAGDVSTEAEVRHKRRRKHAVITRRFVPLSQAQLSLELTSGAEKNWNRPLTLVMLISSEDTLGLVPCGLRILLNCLGHFPHDPAFTPVRDTGHQLLTLCRSVCAEEKAQILDPLMGSK